ncbi:MAG TPA: enoyl-CoA hydratase [Candidatus Binataceae bacterium]|nr:enoyl-CoA hydratase [Candidatus Binataceae bacterium]
MQFSTLLYDTADGIATVTLNRPDKMNSWNATMGREMVAAFREADQDPEVRAIILTGAGERAFCAGADIGGFAEDIKAREEHVPRRPVRDNGNDMLAFPNLVRTMSKPSIAAINGYALGIGITMILPCDIRIMSENAKVGFIFARVGLMAELGSTYFLPRLIGASRAAEMMLTGKQYTAQECLAMGLVSAVTPVGSLLDKAREIAHAIGEGSPLSIEMIRKAIFHGLDGTLEHAMEFENFALERCSRSAEHKEYVSAFIEKRKPDLKRIRKG